MILREERGQITVFLSMVFLVFLGLAFCVLEGVHGYMESSLAEEAFEEAGNEILASYDKYLYRKYHVFFLDPRERTYIKTDAVSFLNHYNQPSYFGFSCSSLDLTEEKTAVDEKGLFLMHQISEYMKYKKTGQTSASFKELAQFSRSRLSGLKAEAADLNEGAGAMGSEDKEEEGDREPSLRDLELRVEWDRLSSVLSQTLPWGLVSYAADQPGGLSPAGITRDQLPSCQHGADDSGEEAAVRLPLSLESLSEWRSFVESGGGGEVETGDKDDYAKLLDYLFLCFSFYGDQDKRDRTALQYELEYLIAGKSTDKENLRWVAEEILWMRFLENYHFAAGDPGLQSEAADMAEALLGSSDLPESEEGIRTLLTVAISYGEALLELHALLSGEKAALSKDSATWNLSFEHAGDQLVAKSRLRGVGQGLSYEDYLRFFLAARAGKRGLIWRMMDMMQVNTCLEEPGFRMEDALFCFRWRASLSCGRWFTIFPGAGRMDPYFVMNMTKTVGY